MRVAAYNDFASYLFSHGHRLYDHSVHASNKWDEIRLKWLYYKGELITLYWPNVSCCDICSFSQSKSSLHDPHVEQGEN